MDNSSVKSGDVIRHKKFKDVCCHVVSRYSSTFKVEWVNMGFFESYLIGISQVIEIKSLKDWQICVDKHPWCYRNATWENL